MSPRSASANDEMRQRSRDRILRATVTLAAAHGFSGTTLSDVAEQAHVARGLVSYYFPDKRYLFQSAVHRLMHTRLAADLAELPLGASPDHRLAAGVDSVLGLALDQPTLMRAHLALILEPSSPGFVQDPEQRKLGEILRGLLAAHGSTDPAADHAVLRSALMGGVVGLLLPGAETPFDPIRESVFRRYGLSPRIPRPEPRDPMRNVDGQPILRRSPDGSPAAEDAEA